MSDEHSPEATLRRIQEAREAHPELADRITRGVLMALHARNIASVEELHDQARRRGPDPGRPEGGQEKNASLHERLDRPQRQALTEIALKLACRYLTPRDIDDIVNLQRKREEARKLGEIASHSFLSFRQLAEKVRDFADLPRGQTRLPESEVIGIRVALIEHFISDQLEFIGVARRHLTIRDIDRLLPRIIGDERGMGRIGGKAAGLFLADCILRRARREDPEAPPLVIHEPESWYLRSDVCERFIANLGLEELHSHKYKDIQQIADEYPFLVKVFKDGEFPPEIEERLRLLLEEAGEWPLIVRSSSLLEDRFGAAFAGKYRSIFLANQGTEEERLEQLMGAIAEVYASALHPDAISYRIRHQLLDFHEGMAVLIQKVVGRRVGDYFFPIWAGVGLSRNEYRRNPRIRPEDGVARIVFGLGTRAVDRVASDAPRMIPLGSPTLRPEFSDEEVARNSQKDVDVLNLARRRFESVPFRSVLREPYPPGLADVVSIYEDGRLRRPASSFLAVDPEDLFITFDRFAGDTPYPAALRWMLTSLEEAYGQPVEIEYAFDGERFYLLQCRPQVVRSDGVRVRVPEDVPEAKKIFTARRDVTSAVVEDIRYIVLVEAKDYDRLPSPAERARVTSVIRALNYRLAGHRFILMGPGRWGTRDPALGIPAGYSDISNTAMLIEVARPLGGYVPEPSFGSHFFQDLIESKIEYLPLYPEQGGEIYREEFLLGTPNSLGALVPEFAEFASVVRVVDVPFVTGGLALRVVMDGDSERALGYLSEFRRPPGRGASPRP